MKKTLIRLGLAAVLTGTFCAMPVVSFAQNAEEVRVDVTLKDADMLAATRMLTSQTGLQFVVEPSAEPFPKITLSLNKVTAQEAVKYLCQAAGAYFRRDENGVYVISRTKPVNEVVKPNNTLPSTPAVKRLRKFKMRVADAEAVYNQIRYGMAFDEMDGWHKVDRFKQGGHAGKEYSPQSNVFLPNMGMQNQFTPISSQAVSQPRTSLEAGNDIVLPGEAAGQDAGGFGGFGRGGQGGGNAPGGQGAGQGGGGAGQRLSGGGLIPDGIDYITFDPVDNSIVVQGTDEQIKAIQDAISLFDVAPRQVLIKVEFITTSDSLNSALGFDWTYQRGGVFTGNRPGSFTRANDPIFINWATGAIATRMKTILQTGRGKTVQSPIIRTMNNQAASVTSSIQTWIFITQVTGIGNGNVISNTVPQQLPINTTLIVRPRINDDNTITMTLSPQLSDIGQLRRSPDGTELPDILTQTISVIARVKNGETIVLGGLNRKQDTGSQSRFPILSDLPVIGQFFRGTSRDRNNSELLIFVTPTIIEEDGDGIGP